MSQAAETIRHRRVRFEEVTPAHEYAAFFDCSIESLIAPHGLPIFDGYDDLDELRLAFFTLESGETITLGEYLNSPQSGTSLYVDLAMQNIPQIVFDSCQQLQVSRKEIVWFYPDWQEEIEKLLAEHGDLEKQRNLLPVKGLSQNNLYEPIDCFNHALKIYTRKEFPEYWAMLQHNLGLAYFDRGMDDLINFSSFRINGKSIYMDLSTAIECFNNSLEIHTQNDFPQKWEINQQDLRRTLIVLKSLDSSVLSRSPYSPHNFVEEAKEIGRSTDLH